MPDFQQQIVFKGIDQVSNVVGGINGQINVLDNSVDALNSQFSVVGKTGAAFASKLKYIGLAAVGVATSLFWLSYRTSDAAESLLNLSQKTGVSVEELQKLNYVADQSNIGAESLAQGFTFLNRAISTAASDGTSEAAQAFQGLQIDLKNTDGSMKSTEQVFYDLSDAFNAGADGPNKVQTAVKLLGRAGAGLIPILNRGSDALRKQGAQFSKYGNLITKDGLKAIEGFNDTVDNLSLTFKGLGSVVAQSLIPTLQPLVEKFADFVASNREVIRTKVTDWVKGLQTAFTNFMPKLEAMWAGFQKFWKVIGGIDGVLKGIALVVGGNLLSSFAQFAGALAVLGKLFLATPFGRFLTILTLIGTAIASLSIAFPDFGKTVMNVITSVTKTVGDFFDWFWKKIQSLLEALHLVDKEANKSRGNPGKAVTIVDQETGKARTVYNDTGLPTQTDLSKIPAGPSAISNPGTARGPLDGIWDLLSGIGGSQMKPTGINIKLDTSNKVENVDIDAALTANVSVNSGPMVLY